MAAATDRRRVALDGNGDMGGTLRARRAVRQQPGCVDTDEVDRGGGGAAASNATVSEYIWAAKLDTRPALPDTAAATTVCVPGTGRNNPTHEYQTDGRTAAITADEITDRQYRKEGLYVFQNEG